MWRVMFKVEPSLRELRAQILDRAPRPTQREEGCSGETVQMV